MERYICIHGHFYQPPRENPWLEAVELQDSAYPYHDWNERITRECYAPNAASRILDEKGLITRIVNNYARISFNFGPTLLAWLETNAPEVYQAILKTDRESVQTFSGHGSALAQAYCHMILPLANDRDRYTQVLWGIKDFEHRFGRKPEGMWLPELAVSTESLETLAELGISFIILAQRQAQRVRTIGAKQWEDVSGGKIDTTMAYKINLPSGREIAAFFYDDAIARDVAFGGVLSNGEEFARRLLGAFSKTATWPQLVNIATDGETFGHHHRFADMALAYVIHYIESNGLAKITNYAEYLEIAPPTREVKIIENTSWSCAHGIERWRSNCGDNSGGHPGWNQEWRAPLRKALDWLRDTLIPEYEEKAKKLLNDPWAARDKYIEVILDRSLPNIERFLAENATAKLNDTDRSAVLKLLELQRHAMLMYSSDGWFFDDISGIETVQVISYAGRVIQLGEELFGKELESGFLKLLAQAKSNVPEHAEGKNIYQKMVKPAMVDLSRVAAHFAMTSLFTKFSQKATVYSYDLICDDYRSQSTSIANVALGRVRVTSRITLESAALNFGAIRFGEYDLNASVQGYRGEAAYQAMVQEVTQALLVPDLREVVRLLDKHFGISTYSLRSIFLDEQQQVLDRILKSTLTDVETAYRQLYEHHYPPVRFFTRLGSTLPRAFQQAAELILSIDIRRALDSDTFDEERIRGILDEAKVRNVQFDTEALTHIFTRTLERMMARLAAGPDDLSLLKQLISGVALARSRSIGVNLWKVQNLYYEMLHTVYLDMQKKARKDKAALDWTSQFVALGGQLSIHINSESAG